MKVLMLGWEFPPHISGGLGTACAGLTHALDKQRVDVLFVVPKLHGDEQSGNTTFIDASSVPFRRKQITILEDEGMPASQAPDMSDERIVVSRKRHTTTIEIPSTLSPYTSASSPEKNFSISQWNYSFRSREERTVPAGLRHPKALSPKLRDVQEPYSFSGTYGPNLLEEVSRYAEVAVTIAKKFPYDVIHAHDWMTYPAGIEAKRISGKPLIVHVHATEIDRSGDQVNSRVFEIERQGMLSADKVVVVSQWTKNIAVSRYGIPADSIEVIHNGIDPKAVSGVHPASRLPGSRIVTFLGRITHQKGPMYFVEAARIVRDQFPDVHFVVAGSGDQLPLMIDRIAQLRLSDRFHFTGFLRGQDIDKVWAMSNVYVMPSVSEPFGIAPLEAIQAGVPVILSNQAGVSEVMPHAIKVDFWNSRALAEAICNVLRFKSLANTLRTNGAEEVRHITWDKAAKKLTTLYYELSCQHEKSEKSRPLFSGASTKKAARASVL